MDLEFLLKKIKKPMSIDKIYEKCLKNGDVSLDEVKEFINKKVESFEIIKTPNNNYVPINKTSFRIGTFKACRDNSGIVFSGDEKYLVSFENKGNAINNDLVMIDTVSTNKNDRTSKVVDIIKRDLNNVVGEIFKMGDSFYVMPLDLDKETLTILLPSGDYIEGMNVICSLDDQRSDNFYVGSIKKEIGYKDDPGMDILLEAYKHGVSLDINEECKKEVLELPSKVLPSEYLNRCDLRDKEIFTIDSVDTKDIDDAISLEMLSNGNYLLGVHIADVTHYVKPGSELYKRAYTMTTSSYLANTVIPMLPHELSNGICSLNPNVDRLAISVNMEIDNNGNVIKYDIYPSVINSKLKMDYDNVNNIFDGKDFDKEYIPFVNTLILMNKLAKLLKNKRLKNGAVNFDRDEIKLITDSDGVVTDLSRRSQRDSENLIQEFMLICNSTVARDMSLYPFIYRIHEEPKIEKIDEFINMLNNLGIKTKYSSKSENVCSKLASLINSNKDNDSFNDMLKVQLLKSFKRAQYSTHNVGHFGLNNPCYTHFTSPIRRFCDTTVHELIHEFKFSDNDKEMLKKKWEEELPKIAQNCSYKEKNADDLERAVLQMKCAEYMEKLIGEEFNGTIVSMDDTGIYVALDNMIEGKVRLKDLSGKYFCNNETYSFISLNGFDDYYLGDYIKLSLVSASKERREINFKVVEKINENSRINKDSNNHAKVLKKNENYQSMYYNVNKGRR